MTANYTTYGVLYNWPAAMADSASSTANPSGVQGVCPDGWHLPSNDEWREMLNYLSDNGHNYDGTTGDIGDKIAKSLASTSGWLSSSDTGAVGNTDYPTYLNKSGFTALPGGNRTSSGRFTDIKNEGLWWSATENSAQSAYFRTITYKHSGALFQLSTKELGLSIRCVRDVFTISTTPASSITETTATSGGSITANGGATVIARGVCWSTSQNPTIDDSKTTDGTGTGSFTSSITGLAAGTTYYVRAYATNSAGTSYGNQVRFNTESENPYAIAYGSLTDDRDGNVYKTVIIGNQEWMAENLKYLPSVINARTESDTTAYYYVYGYSGTNVAYAKAEANYTTYGVLYNWTAAMDGEASSTSNPSGIQGVCPTGWHLPSDAEWTELTDYLGGTRIAGGKLKETGTSRWYSPNTGATNKTGFTALPGGRRGFSGFFSDETRHGYWWSAADETATDAWSLYMSTYNDNASRSSSGKGEGFSVRCVKD
jgi:uncharacterized protein (TIGR02145 family)